VQETIQRLILNYDHDDETDDDEEGSADHPHRCPHIHISYDIRQQISNDFRLNSYTAQHLGTLTITRLDERMHRLHNWFKKSKVFIHWLFSEQLTCQRKRQLLYETIQNNLLVKDELLG
jgi:hypothetical protein